MMKRAALVAAGVTVVVGLAGCSGSSSTSSSSSAPEASASASAPADMQTYTSDQFGYSFEYAPPFEMKSDTTMQAQTENGAAETAAVFDTKGAQVGGQYRDAFMVSVYELSTTVDESNIGDAATALEQSVLPQLKKSATNMQTGELTSTDVNGVPGYQVDATFETDGTPMSSTLYFLFDGNKEYELLTQATTENWDSLQPTFDQMVNSFTVSPDGASPAAS